MSYYLLIIILIICVTADVIIIRKDLLKKYKPETQHNLIFSILTIPVALILMKLDRVYQPLENVSFIIKGIIIGLVLLFINTVIYSLIRKVKV
jgi:uncharacterized membrane protein YesL